MFLYVLRKCSSFFALRLKRAVFLTLHRCTVLNGQQHYKQMIIIEYDASL